MCTEPVRITDRFVFSLKGGKFFGGDGFHLCLIHDEEGGFS
jgi:hypothetical protein